MRQTKKADDFKFPKWMGKYPRLNAPWTPDEEAVLATAFRSGDSLKMIARRHGRGCGGIESRLMSILGENFYVRNLPPVAATVEQRMATLERAVKALSEQRNE